MSLSRSQMNNIKVLRSRRSQFENAINKAERSLTARGAKIPEIKKGLSIMKVGLKKTLAELRKKDPAYKKQFLEGEHRAHSAFMRVKSGSPGKTRRRRSRSSSRGAVEMKSRGGKKTRRRKRTRKCK